MSRNVSQNMTVFLRHGTIEKLNMFQPEATYNEGELVVSNETIYRCNFDGVIGVVPSPDHIHEATLLDPAGPTFTRLCSRDQFRGKYSRHTHYRVGDIVTAMDGIHRCIGECPAGTHVNVISPSGAPVWQKIDQLGSRFPSWITGSHNSITFRNVETFGDIPQVHPASGLRTAVLRSPMIVGGDTVLVSEQHPWLRAEFEKYSATTMERVFIVNAIHFGVSERPPTEDNPSPMPINMFGMHISVLVKTPPGYPGGENKIMLRYINPNAGESDPPMLPDYYQWIADDCPFILQPLSDDPTDQLLCIYNRELHPEYARIMRESSRMAQSACWVDLSAEAFTTYIKAQCHEKGVLPPSDIMRKYESWRADVSNDIIAKLAEATREWKRATTAWEEWRFSLRVALKVSYEHCDEIARSIDEMKWIEGKCDYSKISWTGEGKKYVLSEIVDWIAQVEKLWSMAAADVGGFNTYYLSEIMEGSKKIADALMLYDSTHPKPARGKNVRIKLKVKKTITVGRKKGK